MWRRRKMDHEVIEEKLIAVNVARARTRLIRERVHAQQPEVDARVDRLESRLEKNHFAESMYRTMGA